MLKKSHALNNSQYIQNNQLKMSQYIDNFYNIHALCCEICIVRGLKNHQSFQFDYDGTILLVVVVGVGTTEGGR